MQSRSIRAGSMSSALRESCFGPSVQPLPAAGSAYRSTLRYHRAAASCTSVRSTTTASASSTPRPVRSLGVGARSELHTGSSTNRWDSPSTQREMSTSTITATTGSRCSLPDARRPWHPELAREQGVEAGPEDVTDVTVRPAAPQQLLGDERDAARPFEARYVPIHLHPADDVLPVGAVDLVEHFLTEVRAESDVLDTDDPGDVLDVIDD